MTTRFSSRRAVAKTLSAIALVSLAAAHPLLADRAPIGTPPSPTPAAQSSLEKYVVPNTLHSLQATVVPVQANKDILDKIGKGFAEGYNVSSATYVFSPPDRVEVRGKYGILSGDIVYTNTTRQVKLGFLHTTSDISKDLTKRQTIFVLGLFPQNYLDTVRVVDLGQATVNGIACETYLLRFISDGPNDGRRWQVWISHDQRYMVKKIVWGGNNVEHETIVYSNPVQALPGLWIPTRVEAFDSAGELGGVAEQRDIRAN